MKFLCLALLLAQEQPTVVRDVTVVPMAGAETVLADHAVAFQDGAITWIGPSGEAPSTEGRVIDGTGLYLVPGLIDAHVHLFDETQLALFVANGVTTVFNMSGNARALEWRERIRATVERCSSQAQTW